MARFSFSEPISDVVLTRRAKQTIVRTLAVLTVFFGLFLSGTAVLAAGPADNHGRHLGNSKPTPTATETSAVATTAAATANAPASDPNPGDVWVDNVGQPSGPGHEMDPHLACADIQLWGDKLGDAFGTYAIDGWPPSGAQEQDYVSTWRYNTAQGGVQGISVIPVATLLANARANGDAPVNKQGYHFKLQFSQDPQKHKTFWVDCPAPAVTTPSPTATPTPASTPSSSPSPTPGGGVLGTQTTPTPSPTAATDGASGGVLGISTSTPATGAAYSLIPGLALIVLGLATLAMTGRFRGAGSGASMRKGVGAAAWSKPQHWT